MGLRVYIGGKWRVVQYPREIRRGKNKGRIEVSINKLRRIDGVWIMVPRLIVLDPDQIHTFGGTAECTG